MIDRAKLQHILEYARQQRHIGLHCKVPPEDMVEIVEMAMLHGKADGALTNEGTIPATQIKPVADLYGISVPGGRTTTYSTDAAEASDCRVMGWSVQEYVKLERYQAAMLQGADGNSPVIPDGWQLVPKQITLEMECALSRADSYEIGWRWALAAAPQQEVK